jgi:D-ribose pyranase
MRHKDLICISDCGLPCPEGVELIDLAIERNNPSFLKVLNVVLKDYTCEEYYLAAEIIEANPSNLDKIEQTMGNTPKSFISHEKLKQKLSECKAVIRTGEMSVYSNIILQSACIF